MVHFLITCGPTHSGKTTFAKRLVEKLGNDAKIVRVDNDEVDEFIKLRYKNLRNDPEVLARRTPADPDLRLLIPRLITSYSLQEGYSVIATASHPRRLIREEYYKLARSRNAQIILLMFTIDEATAMSRIENNARSTDILDISPHGAGTFEGLYANQMKFFEEPSTEERQSVDKIYEINPESNEYIITDLVKLLR